MALKIPFARTVFGGGVLIGFAFLLFNSTSSIVVGNRETNPTDFAGFIKLVENGNVDTLSGVYIPSVLALPVVQQPAGDDGYVSGRNDEATQFAMASQYVSCDATAGQPPTVSTNYSG